MSRGLRRRLRSVLAAAATLGALASAAWAGPPATVAAGRAPVTITQWTDFVGNDIGYKYFLSEAAAFHHQYPWITVKIVNSSGIPRSGFEGAIIAGKAPDALATGGWDTMATLAAAGLVLPVESYMRAANFGLASFWPAMQGMVNFGGHTWAWPQEYDTIFFGWNKKLFAASGLDPNQPPRTWAQLVADDVLLTKKVNGKVVQEGMDPYTCADQRMLGAMFGARLYDPATGQLTMNSPAWKLAIEQYQRLIAASGGAAAATAFANNDPNEFTSGKVAMMWVCDWFPTVNFPQTFIYGKDYGLAALPVGPGVPYGTDVYIGSDMFFIPKNAKHPQEAALWFNFLMGLRPVTLWCVAESNVPPTKAGLNDPGFLKSLPWMTIAQSAANQNLVQPYPPIAVWEAYQAGLIREWNALVSNKVPIGNGLNLAQHWAQVALAKFYREHPHWPRV